MNDPLRDFVFKLGASLAEAAKHDGQNNPEQVRATLALDAVNTFLREVGFKAELRNALLDLQAAMSDAIEGRQNALVQPSECGPGSPGRSSKDASRMPLAAALVTLLVEEKKKTDKSYRVSAAAEYVGKKFGVEGLYNYRKNLTGGKLASEENADYWEWLRAFREGDMKNTVTELIDHLAANKA